MKDRLTALIPAHNDDYALWFSLNSIAPYFDEIVVLDDCSDDLTPDVVLEVARQHPHIRLLRHEGERQLGWIEARNRLLAATDSDLLFWLDSDDVLAEYNAGIIRELAARRTAGQRPLVHLQLCEMWGDFDHSTQRLRHYDRCHVFWNRRLLPGGRWAGGSAAALKDLGSVSPGRSDGPLLFHMKGVKPDRRLVERQAARAWMRAGCPGRLQNFAGLAGMSEEVQHRRALRMLLRSRQDRIRRSWPSGGGLGLRSSGVWSGGGSGLHSSWSRTGGGLGLHSSGSWRGGGPQRPRVILEARRRFEMIYSPYGEPVDRLDHGWACDLERDSHA